MAKADLVSISELWRLTGVDRDTINKRLVDITPTKGPKNSKLYDRKLALELILASDTAHAENASKERKARADAEKAELIVARLRGELVPISDMKQSAAELVKTLYNRIVRVLPGVVAPRLIQKDVIAIETELRTELSVVFDELKSLPENFLSVIPDETDADDTESI